VRSVNRAVLLVGSDVLGCRRSLDYRGSCKSFVGALRSFDCNGLECFSGGLSKCLMLIRLQGLGGFLCAGSAVPGILRKGFAGGLALR
jgi:hypothetical protein